jgi:hypothetical protein
MPTVKDTLSEVNIEDQNFVGTIALKSEQVALPDGSKIALGIDGGRWVLIYQKPNSREIVCYEYNSNDRKLLVDMHLGNKEDLVRMNMLISYFFENTDSDDLVTIFPPKVVI